MAGTIRRVGVVWMGSGSLPAPDTRALGGVPTGTVVRPLPVVGVGVGRGLVPDPRPLGVPAGIVIGPLVVIGVAGRGSGGSRVSVLAGRAWEGTAPEDMVLGTTVEVAGAT